MLKNPRTGADPVIGQILSLVGGGGKTQQQETGIFFCSHWSFDQEIRNKKEQWPDFEGLGPYGVCDTVQQVKEKYAKWLNDPALNFCISFTKVSKANQPSDGGWRWHKWGEYIGEKEPQYEYLYDEGPEIEEVFCFHIYQLLD